MPTIVFVSAELLVHCERVAQHVSSVEQTLLELSHIASLLNLLTTQQGNSGLWVVSDVYDCVVFQRSCYCTQSVLHDTSVAWSRHCRNSAKVLTCSRTTRATVSTDWWTTLWGSTNFTLPPTKHLRMFLTDSCGYLSSHQASLPLDWCINNLHKVESGTAGSRTHDLHVRESAPHLTPHLSVLCVRPGDVKKYFLFLKFFYAP